MQAIPNVHTTFFRMSFWYSLFLSRRELMQVEKVINNNIIRTLDENSNELIVMGSGLGFKKKPGDPVDKTKIEKIYRLQDHAQSRTLEDVLAGISLEVIQTVNEIVERGSALLGVKFSDAVYIAMSDHVQFAIARAKNNIFVPNALKNEICSFYPNEFEAGLQAVEIIQRRLDVSLIDDEAGFIALHFISALQEDQNIESARVMTELISNSLRVLKYQCHLDLDTDSLAYRRFITHLKYFSRRLFKLTSSDEPPIDIAMYQMIKSQYKAAYLNVLKISSMIQQVYKKELSNDEMIYLTIHINRLMEVNGLKKERISPNNLI